MYWSTFNVEFSRMTQGSWPQVMEQLTLTEPHISYAVDIVERRFGPMLDYRIEIIDDCDDCDRAVVWTSADRRDVIIARIVETETDAWIPWLVCVDCVDAMFGLADADDAIERVAPQLRNDTTYIGPVGDPEFSWCSCDSCNDDLAGNRLVFLTPRKGD